MTGILGFEPDRLINLPDGRLAVASQLMRGDTQEFAVVISCSDDGGKTWYERSTIAHDGYHRFCEGALVLLNGGDELACVMRENHSAGIPSFVAFSQDTGKTWSPPEMLPFAIHAPYAKQLPMVGRWSPGDTSMAGSAPTLGAATSKRRPAIKSVVLYENSPRTFAPMRS